MLVLSNQLQVANLFCQALHLLALLYQTAVRTLLMRCYCDRSVRHEPECTLLLVPAVSTYLVALLALPWG